MEKLELRTTLENGKWIKIHLALSADKPDVSHLWAPTFDMRIGSAVVKMGGIAGVGTDEEYRKRGYARLVMEESTRYFTETGHDVAMLFGIPDFYHKFGYAPALPLTSLTVNLKDVLLAYPEKPQGKFSIRPLQEKDWTTVLDIYDANNRTRTGTLLRPKESWQGYRHGTEWRCGTETFVVEDEIGGIVGYVVFDDVDNACRLGEVGYETPEVLVMLLMTIVEQAQRRQVEEFEAKLPPGHPFTLFCRRCGGRVLTIYHRNRGGMARIIGLNSLFEKLTGLLSERLSESRFTKRRGALELKTDLGSVILELHKGQVHLGGGATPTWRAVLPQMRLTQLVMGYRRVSEVMLDEGVDLSPEVVPLLDALFPVGHPWMPSPDWF